MKPIAAVLILSAVLAFPAAAADNGCWNRDLERLDFFGNPPSRGDNNFFTFTVSGTANVTMLYPGTRSMRAFPLSLYEIWQAGNLVPTPAKGSGFGCANKKLTGNSASVTYFMSSTAAAPSAPTSLNLSVYDATRRYPEPEIAYSGGGGLADNFEASSYSCTAPANTTSCKTDGTGGKAWRYMLWPANDGGSTCSGTTNCTDAGPAGSIDAECASAVGATSGVDFQDCQLCVKSKGYWLNYNKLSANPMDTSPGAMVAKGNFLNFYPPKWAILRLAYKRLVNGPLLNALREGIVTNCTSSLGGCPGESGEYRLQKMLPQSCDGSGRPSQRIASVDPVTYNATSNPLAEMLFNAAWTVSSNALSGPPATWSFFTAQTNASPTLATHPASEPGVSGQTDAKDGFCPGCNAGFNVMFTDGRGIDGWKSCSSALGAAAVAGVDIPAYCRNSDGTTHNSFNACEGASTSAPGLGLGAEDDGNDYLNPNLAGGAGATITGAAVRATPPNTCPNDYVDDVAAWMGRTDMVPTQPGTSVRLQAVEIGTNTFGQMNAINAAASASGGRANLASDFTTLENNINDIFRGIITTATSFSVAAITTVQTRGTTFAFIPRFRPLPGSQWEGRLYRFRLFNEFAAGCSTADVAGGPDGGPLKDQLNPNGNASCNDIYLQDADGGFVGEDDGGSFVLLDSTQPFDPANGWPARSPPSPARPVWEAGSILDCREDHYLRGVAGSCDDGGTPIAGRQILTTPLDAGIPSPGTALIPFNAMDGGTCTIPGSTLSEDCNVITMTDYMHLGGVNSDYCQSMALTTRRPYASQADCGKDTIRFLDGQDVLHQSTDGGVVRPNVLGDVFHSSPILVTPPAPPFLCDTGILTQCVRTLYAEDGACGSTGGPCTPNSKAAYDAWFRSKFDRQELILVGSNDGMLHAFQAGTAVSTDGGIANFDEGTGVEVWSFIPPDMLPKLQRYVLGGSHQVLIDGSPWVRDIWKDGSGATVANQQKDADEFHTVAIIGERGGGRHYTALDVTDTAHAPKFLWTWPPPGSSYDLAEGESWNDTTPNPPPIGPILVQDASGPISVTVDGAAVRASERWVVAISGGYDPNLIRGRAVYVLDAFDGTLLYKFSRYDAGNSVAANLGPVASPVSLIDSNFDNFFDLAAFGDTEGNLWSIDMLNPATFSGGLVNNWFAGLTFTQFKGAALSQRSPFFQMAGARVFEESKGGVRVYLGSGDRDQIRIRDTDTADGGTCQVDNLRGCIRNNCSVEVNQDVYRIGDAGVSAESLTGHWKYPVNGTALTGGASGGPTFALSADTGAGSCADPAEMDVKYQVSCGNVSMQDVGAGGSVVGNHVLCDFDGGTDAGEECPDESGKPIGDAVAFTSSTALTNSRFYSVKLFDAPAYSVRPRMTNATSQATYNANTLSDANLMNADLAGGMSPGAPGWFVQQSRDLNEKTASGALLLGGCVAWNTLVPSGTGNPDGGASCGGGFIPPSTAFLYQANDDTGAVQCGLQGSNTQQATVRYTQRTIRESVPQQPTPVVSLNARTGQAGYSGVSLEPGGKIPLQISFGAAAVQGDVSWLDVSRDLHNCRHPAALPDGGVATPVCN